MSQEIGSKLWLRDEAELPMTLVTGMIANDGWVLAADRRTFQSVDIPDTPGNAAHFRSETTKIVYAPDVSLIFGFSGDYVAHLAGEKIVDHLRKGAPLDQRLTLITQATQGAWQTHLNNYRFTGGFLPPGPVRQLIVMFTRPHVEMWIVKVDSVCEASPISDQALIGDIHNGAKIFPLLYYTRRSTAQLKLLAAHTILTAHDCSPSAVAGLNMWSGDASGSASEVAADEIAVLKMRSREIDDGICRLLGFANERI
jgi:hypothetical protein